jgi:uncharacterized protein (TIGR03435 family)
MTRTILLTAAAALALSGQPSEHPKFDVAAIKPSQKFAPLRALPGGRFTAAATLRILMQSAYNLPPFQISGGPDWTRSEFFEIDAKAEGNPGKDAMMVMLQSLLEDRFQMKIHRETKEGPIYNLVVAKGGLKLPSPKQATCEGADPTAPLVVQCGKIRIMRLVSAGRVLDGLEGGPVNMAEMVRALTTVMGRPVIDKTGFTGAFDIRLTYTSDQATSGLPPAAESSDPDLPTIFIALQEKLGLKLESAKGPVEMLVIDRVERPSGN